MTEVLDAKIWVDTPGILTISDAEYHDQREWLSSTGARKLLAPSCPALFQHWRTAGQEPKREFDFGHAAHTKVLGIGATIVTVDAADWRTKAAQQRAKEIRAEGHTPLLAHEVAQVNAMADALRNHPNARVLFDPERGEPEHSLFWTDEATGAHGRARIDWTPDVGNWLVDYKTTSRLPTVRQFERAVVDYGYHQQGDFYLRGSRTLGLADKATSFLFVVQMKTAPYLLDVFQLDAEALAEGARLNDEAFEVFRDCTESGLWPAYDNEIKLVGLPRWATPHEEF